MFGYIKQVVKNHNSKHNMCSTPESFWDEWYKETHSGTQQATWELEDCGSSSEEDEE